MPRPVSDPAPSRRAVLSGGAAGVGLAAAGATFAPSRASAAVEVRIDSSARMPIYTTVYGANNEWRHVTGAEFPAFAKALQDIRCELFRFPGGWESEKYDWATNTTPGWSKAPEVPGCTAAQAKTAAKQSVFVLKSEIYVGNPSQANLDKLTAEAAALVKAHGDTVKYWIIGNEWWLQGAGGATRAERLKRYATLASATAARIKSTDSTARVYVTGDWTAPAEFATIKSVFDAKSTWHHVEGIDVHIYAGEDGGRTDYRKIAPNLKSIQTHTGKRRIFASEWAAVKNTSIDNKRALRSVNNYVVFMHTMIRAGVTAACYWPSPDVAQGIGLFREVQSGVFKQLPHAQAFDWMMTDLRGQSLGTSGAIQVAASQKTAAETMTVLIPGKELANTDVVVRFDRPVTGVVSAHAMWMTNPDQVATPASITKLPASATPLANNAVTVRVNPGTTGRGSSYELIKLVVAY